MYPAISRSCHVVPTLDWPSWNRSFEHGRLGGSGALRILNTPSATEQPQLSTRLTYLPGPLILNPEKLLSRFHFVFH